MYNKCKDKEKAALLKERYTEIATAIAQEQYEHLKWYNNFKPKQRSEVMIFTRLNLFTQSLGMIEDVSFNDIDINDIVSVIAKIIENECDELSDPKSNVLTSNATVSKKVQLIDHTYSFLSKMGKIPSVDRKMIATFRHIANYENRKLQRYNVNRLTQNDADEILATLQLVGTAYETARTLGNEYAAAIIEIKNIYDKNVDKFAPYILD